MAKRTRRLPSLNALRAFWAAARHGSFAAAAEELHVTASAVSLQVRQLEEELEMKLFDRTPKGLSLTGEGNRLILAALLDALPEGPQLKRKHAHFLYDDLPAAATQPTARQPATTQPGAP